MNGTLQSVTYLCGHKTIPELDLLASREELYRAAESFSCPACCRESAITLGMNTQVYVNMQSLSDDMSALVLEVTQCCPPLENLLALTGYARRARSLDELNPGGKPKDERKAVWRKEFWFAAATNPFHVIALIELVKDEARWLQDYLLQPDAVHFLDFPEID